MGSEGFSVWLADFPLRLAHFVETHAKTNGMCLVRPRKGGSLLLVGCT